MNCQEDVLICYEMNEEPLNRDHGFPIRAVVPGCIGARSVKWLTKIIVRPDESQSYYQQSDYKVAFSPLAEFPWEEYDALLHSNINSVVCNVLNGDTIPKGKFFRLKGYAYSGRGNAISRVDISMNGGKTWKKAKITIKETRSDDSSQHWIWAFWEYILPEGLEYLKTEMRIKAWDICMNTQPD
jgi:sulfite oxidase